MTPSLRHFLHDESAAITVDWVVLAAAVAGLGIAAVAAVRTGTHSVSAQVSAGLSSATLVPFELPYMMQGLTPPLVADRIATYQSASTDQIIAWHRTRADLLTQTIAAGHQTPTGNWSNLSAGETLDVLYLHRQELMARGAYPVDGVPEFNTLFRQYLGR